MTFDELKNFFSNDRFAMNTGCEIQSADKDGAVVSLDVEEKHFNGNGTVQGGVIFTLADFACAVAANAEELAFVSADGSISFMNAATGKKLVAEAEVVKKGKTLAFCEAVITDENNRLIAKTSFTMCRLK